ncbi:MAG TPA: TrkA C-terminal domain-containing protein, partial [Phycisphaerae bacterium]|nr:TrkA C-terminal domain-containing protein [Phycisphaerae bacterium]
MLGSILGVAQDHPALVLLAVITLGLVLGKARIAGLSLGSSGVIFAALAAGHFGFTLPAGIGSVGLVLFIYCIGLSAGPSFFRAFRRQGVTMSLLAIAIVALGAITTWALGTTLHIPRDLAAGIFAGALTSTPGLAAGLEALPSTAHIGVGFGLAYPFGLVGVVLFVHLFPRLLGLNIEQAGREAQPFDVEDRRIVRVLVKVLNPAVIGRKLADLAFIREYNCQISRMLVGNRLVPLQAGLVLEEGQHLLLVARAFRLPPVIQLLGERDDQAGVILDTEDQSQHVVATDRRIVGKTLYELNLRSNFGVTVTRIIRHDQEFVPRLADRLQYGDMLNVVGE